MSEGDDAREGITRRGFVKGTLAVGIASVAVGTGFGALATLTGERPVVPQETFLYVNPEGARVTPWFVERGLVGKQARISHFEVGEGASVTWRWHLDEGGNAAGGVPALLMRMDENELEFPPGYAREDFVIAGLYAVFNCCTHRCCRPGWQLLPRSEYGHDLGLDTIFCPCHCAQFHPTRIAVDTHPGPPEGSGSQYIGVAHLTGPGDRGMPLIPIELRGDLIVGKLRNPDWYRYLDTMRRPLP